MYSLLRATADVRLPPLIADAAPTLLSPIGPAVQLLSGVVSASSSACVHAHAVDTARALLTVFSVSTKLAHGTCNE